MSRHGEITLPFGAEERLFRLGIGQIRAIEERCNAGIPELLMRLEPLMRGVKAQLTFSQLQQAQMLGTWRIDDVREVLLQGLIGGGMPSTEAGILIRAVFDEKISLGFAPTAYLVMEAAWHGPPDDLPGEPPAAPKKPARRRSPKAGHASPT